jgi:hypothetical protein
VKIKGINGIRPAGDTVGSVTVHEGGMTAGRCEGQILGRAKVNRGNGRWLFEQAVAAQPGEVCVSSPAGGIGTARL